MEKHYLASANSCDGFKNYFNNINPFSNSFTYILKGGPGTGKSTIIKRFAKNYLKKGYSVEYFYCSSDPKSLDGVRIKEKNIAIVDGTAPHITEATIPEIKEKIINVGAFINPEIKKHKKVIELNLSKKQKCFSIAYTYLKAIKGLIEIEKLKSIKNQTKIDLSFFKLTPQKTVGGERTLFASFITSKGIKYTYNQNPYKKIICLKNSFFENSFLLNELSKELKQNNYKFIKFLSVLDTNLIEAIYIENTDTLVLSFKPDKTQTENFENKYKIDSLIKKAGFYIEKAKNYHKKVEKYYISNMNFDKLNKFLKTLSPDFC